MVCLEPLNSDEFTLWYRHVCRLKLFWARPLVEFIPLYRLTEGCMIKARWSSGEKPGLEEAYIAILKKAKKLDFMTQMRGTKILITGDELDKNLYTQRGAMYIYSTARPCATGVHVESPGERHHLPSPDHVVLSKTPNASGYVIYLNKWSFNIDYMWLEDADMLDDAIEAALCEARRSGAKFVTVASDEGHLANLDLKWYKPDYLYNVYKLKL